MKLYFAPRTRASRPRWLLEELGLPYELVVLDLSKQENQTSEYLTLQPFGELPALVDGDVTLFESLAICLYLADSFPEKQLAPSQGSSERGSYYQWLIYAETRIEPVLMEFLKIGQLPEEQRAAPQIQSALAAHRVRLDVLLEIVDAELDGRVFIVDGRFTAADLVMASILHLANTLNLLEGFPLLVEYVQLHCRRPALRRAISL